MYSYSDLNDYIHQYMNKKGRKTTDRTGDKYNINLSFILSTYRILIQIGNKYQLYLRNSKFGELIGYSEKTVNKTETGDDLPNITNSIDMIYINTDAIPNCILNGVNTNTLAVIPTDNLTRRFHLHLNPENYCLMKFHN